MCHYHLPAMVAALTRDSAERPANSPADRRPDGADITRPAAENHLVSTVSRATVPHTTILEGICHEPHQHQHVRGIHGRGAGRDGELTSLPIHHRGLAPTNALSYRVNNAE